MHQNAAIAGRTAWFSPLAQQQFLPSIQQETRFIFVHHIFAFILGSSEVIYTYMLNWSFSICCMLKPTQPLSRVQFWITKPSCMYQTTPTFCPGFCWSAVADCLATACRGLLLLLFGMEDFWWLHVSWAELLQWNELVDCLHGSHYSHGPTRFR